MEMETFFYERRDKIYLSEEAEGGRRLLSWTLMSLRLSVLADPSVC